MNRTEYSFLQLWFNKSRWMIRETTGAIGAGLSGGASLNDTLAGGGGEHALLADVTV